MLYQLDNRNNLILKDGKPIRLYNTDENCQYVINFLKMFPRDNIFNYIGIDWIDFLDKSVTDENRRQIVSERLDLCPIIDKVENLEVSRITDKDERKAIKITATLYFNNLNFNANYDFNFVLVV